MNERDQTIAEQPWSHSRIAILEDNIELRETVLVPGLREYGFSVTGVGTAAELYRCMLTHQFDIVVLDFGLHGEDGLRVARYLRQVSNIGIVILTAHRGTRHAAPCKCLAQWRRYIVRQTSRHRVARRSLARLESANIHRQ